MNKEMVDGYCDGLDPHSPEPGPNRSHSYRHGFLNGRDDFNHTPRAAAQQLREQAAQAEIKDGISTPPTK